MLTRLLHQTQGGGEAAVRPLGYGTKSHRRLAGPEVASDDGDANWRGVRGSLRRRGRHLRRQLDGERRAVIIVLHGGGEERRETGAREKLESCYACKLCFFLLSALPQNGSPSDQHPKALRKYYAPGYLFVRL
jgi:hypothetical protein